MRARTRDRLVLLAGALIVALGVGLALWGDPVASPPVAPPPVAPYDDTPPEASADEALILAGFKGELKQGGMFGPTGEVVSFVIGHIVRLDVESRGLDEFRWTCNGKVLVQDGREWSAKPTRDFPFDEAGKYRFKVEGRKADRPEAPVPSLEKAVEVKALEIVGFEINPDNFTDRYLIGDAIALDVLMAEPISEVPYRFRFSLNGKVLPNDADGEEWSEWGSLSYTFEEAGKYLFKVEARRESAEGPEATRVLDKTLVVARAVVEFFLPEPETATVGSAVSLMAVLNRDSEKGECRIGVLDLQGLNPDQSYHWLANDDGKIWDADGLRTWTPAKAGDYRLRVEVRPDDQTEPSDFREILYSVRPAPGDF
ncbi:MAG: hypothetical protein M5U26_09640 [Planctomycetota bacterium]|nr:hypothetical protein [Planctomycetota bacterium]